MTALVIDNGLFMSVACKLAESFGQVLYFSPWHAEAFPTSRRVLWGTGLPGVERINDLFGHIDDADLVVVPDLGAGDLQAWLRKEGFRVWGAGESEILELDRVGLKRLMLAKGMARPPTWLVEGITALGEHLQDPENTDQYVKLSTYRADLETFRHRDWFRSEQWFNHLKNQLGPMGEQLTFVVEDKIDGVEIGFDGICIDGRFPATTLFGIEVKDLAYGGCIVPYEEIPQQLQEVNADLSPVLEELHCRSMLSTEVRVKKNGTGYLIDATLRQPSPPGGGMLEAYSNWAEVMYAGAGGDWVEPIPKTAYVATLILRSQWAKDGFLPVRYPKEYAPFIKLHGHAIIDGIDYVVAISMDTVGEAIGLGNTMEEAMEHAVEVAESVEGHLLDFESGAFDELKEKISEAQAQGIPWS